MVGQVSGYSSIVSNSLDEINHTHTNSRYGKMSGMSRCLCVILFSTAEGVVPIDSARGHAEMYVEDISLSYCDLQRCNSWADNHVPETVIVL